MLGPLTIRLTYPTVVSNTLPYYTPLNLRGCLNFQLHFVHPPCKTLCMPLIYFHNVYPCGWTTEVKCLGPGGSNLSPIQIPGNLRGGSKNFVPIFFSQTFFFYNIHLYTHTHTRTHTHINTL